LAKLSDVRLRNLTSSLSEEEQENDDKRGANQKEFVRPVVNIKRFVGLWNHEMFEAVNNLVNHQTGLWMRWDRVCPGSCWRVMPWCQESSADPPLLKLRQ